MLTRSRRTGLAGAEALVPRSPGHTARFGGTDRFRSICAVERPTRCRVRAHANPRASDAVCALVAVGIGLIVGLDGSYLSCAVRLFIVVTVCVAVGLTPRQGFPTGLSRGVRGPRWRGGIGWGHDRVLVSDDDRPLGAARRPVLLIAAGRVADEAHADKWIQAGSPSTVTIWVVPGATHTGGLHTQPQECRPTSFELPRPSTARKRVGNSAKRTSGALAEHLAVFAVGRVLTATTPA